MTNDIDKFIGGKLGNGDHTVSEFLFQFAKQVQGYETEIMNLQGKNTDLTNKLVDEQAKNKLLEDTIHNHEEYGVRESKIHADTQPSKLLDSKEAVRVINDTRAMSGLKGNITKYDVNKKAEELEMVKMEGSYIVSVCDKYSSQINIRSKTIVEFSNECFRIIVDSFKPHC